jgi:hypothetical protein
MTIRRGTIRRRLDRPDETVSQSGKRFDPMRRLGRIAKNGTDPLYSVIQAMVEIDEGIRWPERFLQLFSRDQVALSGQQHLQHLERLARQLDANAVLAQFVGAQVRIEHPKMNGGVVAVLITAVHLL